MRVLRRLAIVGMLLLPVLAIAYLAYWSWMAGRIKTEVSDQAERFRQAGYTVAWRNAEVDGFPFSFQLVLDQPNFEQNLATPAYALYADVLRARARPFDLSHWDLESGGDTGLDVSSGPGNARISLRMASLAGSLEWGATATLVLHASDLTMQTTATGGAMPIARADATMVWPATAPGAPALRTSLSLHDLRLRQAGSLGDLVSQIDVDAAVSPAVPPGRWPDALARWRDNGGHVDLGRVQIAWGALNVSGSGTLTLDQAVQPTGSGTARIAGLGPTLDALVERGAMRPADGAAAKLAVAALGGQSGIVTVPVRLDSGHLFLGPIRLLDIPPLVWP